MPKRKKKASKLDSAKLVDYMSVALVVLLGLVVLNKNTSVRDAGDDVAENVVVEEENGETVDVEGDFDLEVVGESGDELSASDGVVEDFVALDVFSETEDMVAALDNKIAGYFDDSLTEESMIAATETKEGEAVETKMFVGVSVLPEGSVVAYEETKVGGVPVPIAASVTVLPEGVVPVVTANSNTDIATAQMAVGVTVRP